MYDVQPTDFCFDGQYHEKPMLQNDCDMIIILGFIIIILHTIVKSASLISLAQGILDTAMLNIDHISK